MKSNFRHALLTIAVSALAVGCATSPGNVSPQAAVFATKSAYAVTLSAAVAYKNLPACKVPAVQPCSDARIVAQLQKADNTAAAALDAAELAVRSGVLDAAARDRALKAAEAALASFSAVTKQIGGTK